MVVKLYYSNRIESEEISPEFMQKMLNRMMVGRFRYCPLSKNPRPAWMYMRDKIRKFLRTGNRELLVDIANYAASEYRHPRHPKSHYEDEDQGGRHMSQVAYFHLLGKGE